VTRAKTAKAIVDDALAEYVRRASSTLGDNLVLIKLYGSHARGEAREHSDVDVLVVVKKKNASVDDIVSEIEMDVLDSHEIFISTVIFELREFNRLNRLKTNFMLNVEEDGITLWQANAPLKT
jgi:predicted nucleotidyltransferase